MHILLTRKKSGQIFNDIHTKGQLISKCLFEKIVWTKIPPKNLIDSALRVYTNFQGRIYQIFGWYFVSKRFFQKDILKLTDL